MLFNTFVLISSSSFWSGNWSKRIVFSRVHFFKDIQQKKMCRRMIPFTVHCGMNGSKWGIGGKKTKKNRIIYFRFVMNSTHYTVQKPRFVVKIHQEVWTGLNGHRSVIVFYTNDFILITRFTFEFFSFSIFKLKQPIIIEFGIVALCLHFLLISVILHHHQIIYKRNSLRDHFIMFVFKRKRHNLLMPIYEMMTFLSLCVYLYLRWYEWNDNIWPTRASITNQKALKI